MKKETFAKLNVTAVGVSVGIVTFLASILMGGMMGGYGMMNYGWGMGTWGLTAGIWMSILTTILSGATAWIYNWMLTRM